MYESVLYKMRQCVRQYKLIISRHAKIELRNDGLGQSDVEYAILTGSIIERQRDIVTLENKYRVAGMTYDGRRMEVVAKILPPDEALVITAYLL
jgi:hypothetical protein